MGKRSIFQPDYYNPVTSEPGNVSRAGKASRDFLSVRKLAPQSLRLMQRLVPPLRGRQPSGDPLAGLFAGSDSPDLLNCLGFNCFGLIAQAFDLVCSVFFVCELCLLWSCEKTLG